MDKSVIKNIKLNLFYIGTRVFNIFYSGFVRNKRFYFNKYFYRNFRILPVWRLLTGDVKLKSSLNFCILFGYSRFLKRNRLFLNIYFSGLILKAYNLDSLCWFLFKKTSSYFFNFSLFNKFSKFLHNNKLNKGDKIFYYKKNCRRILKVFSVIKKRPKNPRSLSKKSLHRYKKGVA